jgi:hypothetical protein
MRTFEKMNRLLQSKEIEKLRAAIRKHRDQRGDDRCWMDDEELYRVLPEGFTPPARDTAVELANCERFIACRQNPATEYVSPNFEIGMLEERVYQRDREIERLNKVLADLLKEMEKDAAH